MATYLMVKGSKPYEFLLDTVDRDTGTTIKHLYCFPSAEEATNYARMLVNNDPNALASLALPIGEYRMYISADEIDAAIRGITPEQRQRVKDELAKHGIK